MELPLGEISELIGGEVVGDANRIIRSVAPFEEASGDDITYAGSVKYLKMIKDSRAGAVIVPQNCDSTGKDIIKVDDPRNAFARVVNIFYPKTSLEPGQSVHACIGTNFSHGKEPSIGPFVFIGKNVVLGDNVRIHPQAYLGDDVVMGDDVEIFPNVTIGERCRIGNRVIIHSGTVIGADGFGFAPEGTVYCKVPQIGIVQVDDDVEIGAGNTIDRATFGKTWIKRGVKTDNLVHIAHNVVVGEDTLLVAQVGIAGSVTIGNHCILAGQAGVVDHLTIGDNVTVGPRAAIIKSIPDNEVVSGFIPAMPHRWFLKVQSVLFKLPDLKKRIDKVEKKIESIMTGNT